MLDVDRLRRLLHRVPGATLVDVGREGAKLIALVVSPDFDGMEEHERQALVWALVLEELSDAEQAEVGYVFTNTPPEQQQAQQAAASA